MRTLTIPKSAALGLLAILLVASCLEQERSRGKTGGGAPTCDPGATDGCTCDGDRAGSKTCSVDGESWSACECASEGEGEGEGPAEGEGEGEGEGPAEGEGEGPVEPGDCPTDAFVDVGSSEGAGDAYPDPSLSVRCTDDSVIVESNGIPHYEFTPMTPNALRAQDHRWEIPRSPTVADQTSTIPCLGTVGFAVNGLPFYGPNEAQRPDPYGDPVANGIMDWCMGHTGGQGDYHYHALLVECLSQGVEPGDPSPILGYALDGFPVYGPTACADSDCDEVIEVQSSWEATGYESLDCVDDGDCGNEYACAPTIVDGIQRTACVSMTYAWQHNAYVAKNGDAWLDECNGRIGPDGTYRYHATGTFPYLLGCYRGTAETARGGECPEEGGGGDPGGGPGGDGPPEAAIDACEGANEDDPCEFDGARGPVRGTCRVVPTGDMACVPEGGRPPQGG